VHSSSEAVKKLHSCSAVRIIQNVEDSKARIQI